MNPADLSSLAEDDEVVLAGTDAEGRNWGKLACTVAAVMKGRDGLVATVKVWPKGFDGKLYFHTEDIRSVELVWKGFDAWHAWPAEIGPVND